MSDSLQKVKPGDPLRIPASTFNTIIDVARDFRARQQTTSRTHRPASRNSEIIHVRNDSGADRQRFDVLGVSAAVFAPATALESFLNYPAVTGVTPAEADHPGRFVVLMEPITNGAVGLAMIDGICQCKVNVTDESHAFADVADGQAGYLASGAAGSAAILWKESGTGQKWAIVRLGNAVSDAAASDSYWMAVTGITTVYGDYWNSIATWTIAQSDAAGTVIPGGRTGFLVQGNRWQSGYPWPPHSSNFAPQLVLRCWCIDEEHSYYACQQLTPPTLQAQVTAVNYSNYEARLCGKMVYGTSYTLHGSPFIVVTPYGGQVPSGYAHTETAQDLPAVNVGDIIPVQPVGIQQASAAEAAAAKWMDATPRVRMNKVNGVWVVAGSQSL